VLTFRWKYETLKQIDVIKGRDPRVAERLGHFHRTRSQSFACAKKESAPKFEEKNGCNKHRICSLNVNCS